MLLFSAPEHHKQIGAENVAPKIGSSRNLQRLADIGPPGAFCQYGNQVARLHLREHDPATAERAKEARKEADRLAYDRVAALVALSPDTASLVAL